MVWPGGTWSQEAEYFMPPKFVERKGSLYLRSDCMHYSPKTLISDWHAEREAEPKDYNFYATFKTPAKDRKVHNMLHQATYKRIGNEKNRLPVRTTSQDANISRRELTERWRARPSRKSMVNASSILSSNLKEPYPNNPDFSKVLNVHSEDHSKQRWETTQGCDFRKPHPFKKRAAINN